MADFDDAEAHLWARRLEPAVPNYVLETSPGRFQAFFLFDRPETVERAKPIAERLRDHGRCDHGTVDLSHVWRIGGCLNWPNAKKVGEGRSKEPTIVRVAQTWCGRTSIEQLDKALPNLPKKSPPSAKGENAGGDQVDVTLLRQLPAALMRDIVSPKTPGDRSKQLFSVISRLTHLAISRYTIERIIRAHPAGIGEKYINRATSIRRLLASSPNRTERQNRDHRARNGKTP